jgi:glycyl-tRNA synthetase beta chain
MRPTTFASPRRLAVHVTGVRRQGAPTRPAQQTKLMPVAVALDAAGAPRPRC